MAARKRHTWPWAAAAAAALALAAGGIYVSRPASHARMLADVNARLSAVLGRQFVVGSVRYRFPLSIVIRDVAVASHDSVARGTLAALPEIRVVASPWRSLFSGRFTVSSVVLRNARISLEQDRDGTWNFSGLLKDDSTKPKHKGPASFPRLALSDITVENMTIDLRTPRASETIEQVNLALGLRMGGPHLAVDLRDLRALDRTRGASIDGLSGRVALDGDTIRAEQLQLRSGGSSLFLSGWMEGRRHGLALTSCRAVLELQDLAALTRTPRSAWAGTVRLDATASGSTDAPQARVAIDAGPCRVNGIRIDGLEARAAVDGSAVSLEQLVLHAGSGEIAASAKLDDRLNVYSGSATLSRLDLGRMLPPARKALATDLNARLDFSGRGYNLATMAGQLRLAMSRSSVNAVPISSLEARLAVGDGEAAIEQLTLRSGQASLAITGDVYKDAVSIELETDEIELAQFGPLIGLNNLNGKLHFTGLISGPLKNPDVIGTFRLKEVMLGDFACHYFDGSMSIKSVTTRPLGHGKFTAQEIYLGKQTINRIDVLTELRGTDWGGVSIVVDKDSITSAKIDARAEINGKDINIIVSKLFYAVGDQYVANSQPVKVSIAGPAITLQPTELLVARGRLKLEGQYRADRTFRAKISGRDIDSRRLVALAGLDKTVHGTLDFDAEASGPLADPVLSLSLDIANPRYEQFAYDALDLAADYSGQTLRLHKLAIYHYGQESDITAQVGIDLGVGPGMGKLLDKPMSAEVVLRDIGTGLFFPMADLLSFMEGRVDVNVKASGTPFKPLLSGNLTINQA
ncbi:MAG TPA: hypothetical protein VMF29_09385, partial [Candidatus Edwardsbacteria bacterium]|nr:hypothetical protein [Candidatus Edwardsbacteria bacterium]